MTVNDKIEAVRWWNEESKMHPLTCGSDSNHRPLVGFACKPVRDGVALKCLDCSYRQVPVPDVVYRAWLEEH